jgi:hypothetical protein
MAPPSFRRAVAGRYSSLSLSVPFRRCLLVRQTWRRTWPQASFRLARSDADTTNPTHIQAIANTAAFHFGFIEQAGACESF